MNDQRTSEYLYKSPARKLPPDLYPHRVKQNPLDKIKQGRFTFESDRPKTTNELLVERIAQNSDILVSFNILERGFIGRQISITTAPVEIIDAKFMRAYTLLNPSSIAGSLTTSGTVFPSALRDGTGNTQATPLGVGNFRNLVMFLNITAITATPALVINAQSQDPISLNWVETQGDLFSSASTVGISYVDIGSFGVDNALALDFEVTGGGADITFSVGFILKDGLTGSSSGVANTIYLGGPDVNQTTGFPLLEGQKANYWVRPNAKLFAVSLQSAGVTLNVFDLQ